MDARRFVSKLPVNGDKKLKIYKKVRETVWKYKYGKDRFNELVLQDCLIPQNSFYGHEYWIKKYSGYNGSIKGLIEHGCFFKCETDKIGWDVEWDLGSILTFGDCRFEVLKELYPDYSIFRIGPRIHYSPIDVVYYEEIKRKIDPQKKTMVLYPAHSLATRKSDYDIDLFLEDALDFAKDNNIGNILVSLHPSDIANGFDKDYYVREKRLIIVTGGTNNVNFLPRIKAILSLADITYSNLFGTHIGYSIYMNKPHIINANSDGLDSTKIEMKNYLSEFQTEKERFIKVFRGDNPWMISVEQRELIDYYFGLSHVKSKGELYSTLISCENVYNRKFGIKQ